MNIIADTNIWYRIASGAIEPAVLKRNGDKLIALQVSLLEIASSSFHKTFPEIKAAARAVLDHADDFYCSGEAHLAYIWGLSKSEKSVDKNVLQTIKTIAEAKSFVDLNLKIKANDSYLWRKDRWLKFRDMITDIVDKKVSPGYKEARNRGQCRRVNSRKGEIFKKQLFAPCEQKNILLATYERALKEVGKRYKTPSERQFKSALDSLFPYIEAYSLYLVKCATSYAPQPNDCGDLDCFLFLHDNNRLLTKDDRWFEIANAISPEFIYEDNT